MSLLWNSGKQNLMSSDRIPRVMQTLAVLLLCASACTGEISDPLVSPPAPTPSATAASRATSQPLPTDTARPADIPMRTDAPAPTITATRAVLPSPTAKAPPSPTATAEPTAPPTATATRIAEPTPLPTATATATIEPSATPVSFPPAIALELAWGGFQQPLYLAYSEHDSERRLFVVERAGRVLIIENGAVLAEPFLDISERAGSQGSEQGLLGIAFTPAGSDPDTFYVNYTNTSGDTIVARFRLSQDGFRRADRGSEQVILQIPQPASNHNGGQLLFGPDGYLYVAVGDGGQGGDPWGNGQNPETLLGKILRLDVQSPGGYQIPAGNPFVGRGAIRPEIWALGLRNPWRFSFDRLTGDLYIADVGQSRYEEIHYEPAGGRGGANYGWDIMEGSHCFEPEKDCDTSNLVLPVAEYDHGLGCSVTGGAVYRGNRHPSLNGVYFYGDFCTGNVWGLRRDPSGQWQSALLLQTGLTISSFGEDVDGELYVIGYNDGSIYRMSGAP